jgi:hypothetical protein
LSSYGLSSTVHFPTRYQNNSATATDNIDATKFSNHITTPIINGLSDHVAQLINIHDIKLKLQKDKPKIIRIINKHTITEGPGVA